MASTVRVDPRLHARLREISEDERRPIGQVIEDAIGQYEREKFWREVHASVERLRADPAAWQAYQDEIALFEGGSMDGLAGEESYYTPEEEEAIRAEHARTQGR
jgi:predicted transcriptional regulator